MNICRCAFYFIAQHSDENLNWVQQNDQLFGPHVSAFEAYTYSFYW